MGSIFQQRNAALAQTLALDSITLGTVISNTDPHQMGRLKILCPNLGDDLNDVSGENLPWATQVSPFGGMTNSTMLRGANEGKTSKGPVAYGFWNIPKVGSTVLVCCIDGDPYYRLWLGSIFDQGGVNTLPHGRYFYNEGTGEPEGPLDSYEQPIEPLYTNQTKAFVKKSGNYEWRTRGADYSASGNLEEFVDHAPSSKPDETIAKEFKSADGKSFTVKNGYAEGRGEGRKAEEASSIYSWTTPGFHSIAMDDRPENCRVRVRTTAGSQILMDDTNERIYVSTPQGENWIEMDFNGNVDIFGRRVSVHSTKDMSFTSDETIRMFAKKGIHMYSEDVINMESKQDINIGTAQNLRVKTAQGILTESLGNTNIKSAKDVNIEASKVGNVKSGAALNLQAGAGANIKAGGQILNTGTQVHFNGPAAAAASPAEAANPEKAKWTSRIPTHEPFSRVVTKEDYSHDPEFEYDDPNVGKVERGEDIERGKLWRR